MKSRYFLTLVLLLTGFALARQWLGAQEAGEAPLAPNGAATQEIPAEPGDAAQATDTAEPGDAAQATDTAEPGDAAETGDTAESDEDAFFETPESEDMGEPFDPYAEALSEYSVLDMDIRTSTLNELAAWCRSLGLGEGGSREDLARRLREYYRLPARASVQEEEDSSRKTITIESARSTEYFTLEVVDEEYARLRGDVIVSLKDGNAVHRIQAWEILYNRTRNILSAYGGVVYIKEDGDTRETYRGESITVDLDNWASIFMDSVSERSLTGDETVYRFSGRLITRSDENVTILTNAEITNGASEEAYWSIKASKLWLLPGSDWAIFNAILKVGEIPTLYIPFFFYPADELIFHPVIGFRSREGNFVQTTTYILGRPRADSSSESSINKILGASADMEKVQEGVFLRSTGQKSRDPNTTRLSVLLDAYSNLGAYLGTELNLPALGMLRSMDFSAGLGLTRNVYKNEDSYTPFAEYDGSSDWNMSQFFATTVPLRYRMESKGSLSGKYGNLSWTFPLYADPFVNRDFLNRAESMDWFGMMKQGNSRSEEEEISKTIISSYEWRLSGALNPQVRSLNPYITSLSISSASSSVSFRTRESTILNATNPRNVSPDQTFFFPDKFTLASVNAVIQGTPLTLGNRGASRSTSAASSAGAQGGEDEGILDIQEELRPPWAPIERDSSPPLEADHFTLRPPPLNLNITLGRLGYALPRFTIDYRLSPSSSSEMQYQSTRQNWPEVTDVDWSEITSILTSLRTDGSVTFALTEPDTTAYSQSFRVYGNAAWQDYSLINEEAEDFNTPQKIDAAMNRVNTASFYTFSTESITTLKPLYWDRIWGNTNIQYTLRNLLVKSIYNNDPANAEWENQWGAWEKETIDVHTMGLNLSALIWDKSQTISIVNELPPKDHSLSMDAAMRVWISETSVRERILMPFEEDERKFEPLSFTEVLRFTDWFTAQQTFTYDPEIEEFTNLASTVTITPFRIVYTASRSRPYQLIPGQGWALDNNKEESLNPRELRIEYSQSLSRNRLWRNRLSFSINANSSFAFDLQRYTNSRLSVSLGLTLGISNFLDLSLNVSSENASMFRYFQNLPIFDLPDKLNGEENFFIDLLNSFRFDDEVLRKSSGFKLKSFTFSATHHLGDWDAKVGITLSPYLEQNPGQVPYYKFNNEISFIVQWRPITEIKTDIYVNRDEYLIR